MTLTKAHIEEDLFGKNIFTKGESDQIIETLFKIMKQTFGRRRRSLHPWLRKVLRSRKNRRRSRNSHTGQSIMQLFRGVTTFKRSGVLREKINVKDPRPHLE